MGGGADGMPGDAGSTAPSALISLRFDAAPATDAESNAAVPSVGLGGEVVNRNVSFSGGLAAAASGGFAPPSASSGFTAGNACDSRIRRCERIRSHSDEF